MKSSCLVLVFCLALAGLSGRAQEALVPSSQDVRPNQITAEAWKIYELANQARAESGAAPLQWDSSLAEAARKHAERMSTEETLSHHYPGEPELAQRASEAGAHFSLIKENVASGADPQAIHEAWMNADESNASLVSTDMDRTGVAVTTRNGALYAVAVYARFAKPMTQEQVEVAVAAVLQKQGMVVAQNRQDARWRCMGREGLSVPPVASQVLQSPNMNSLAESLDQSLSDVHFTKAAVGSCPAKNVSKWETQFRVAVLFYNSWIGVN
jgi:hypothetical protein